MTCTPRSYTYNVYTIATEERDGVLWYLNQESWTAVGDIVPAYRTATWSPYPLPSLCDALTMMGQHDACPTCEKDIEL